LGGNKKVTRLFLESTHLVLVVTVRRSYLRLLNIHIKFMFFSARMR